MSKMAPQIRFQGFTDYWEERKFKDIIKTHSSRSYLANVSENGEYEVIQQGDKPIVGYSDGEPFSNYKDITLFGDHTVSLYHPKKPFFVATDGVKILSADNFEGDYLYTTLERYKPEPQGYKRHFTILKNQNVWFTENIEEQQKIGAFFKQLDDTITLHQRKLDLLKEQKKGFLQKMFPKNGAKIPELRFSGFADDWEQRKLSEVVDVKSGRDYKHLNSGNIPVYGTGGYMLSVDEALSYDKDAIGIGRKGTIDKPYILKSPFWTVDTLFYVLPLKNNYLFFMFTIFQNINWKMYDESTGVPSLSKTVINKVTANIPNIEEQQKIGSFFQQLDNLITLHQRMLDLLKEQKKGFLQKMFVS
ncbi:restriction endonuclease subunit S [Leuconostoc gelidum subsp. gasicomitatum]|uniref:restriction endonuclease subunit S n=1 Tax=Leuconostoc gasicomitatum TaxID=115778 RepID=UPI001A9A78AA|nr:restriction endonuclease subunit S [Leuconostoc gasicomitatum]MBZ5957734.1 restriction endonuclease subunit S [Leuconostoc gasicomitatum]MBZ5969753.1 restriction endonuclease subunit S [Leuconostoc gasicomitatum]